MKKKDKYNVAVVGATGLVGSKMLEVLAERNFPIDKLSVLASKKSAGNIIKYRNISYSIEELNENSFDNVDIALFSCGKSPSLKFAPIAASKGCVVIDNSSAWRMDPTVPLVVPEVNPDDLSWNHNIIANPNCSTIQLVVALKPLHDTYDLKRVIVSTYQSVSGAGQKGVDKLMNEIKGKTDNTLSEHKIAFNLFFHSISEGIGSSEEEIKMTNESRKILHLPDLNLIATCVRLPILGGHGESVNIETFKHFEIDEVQDLLSKSPNIIIMDEPEKEIYPTPAFSNNRDEVFVGRIRRDYTCRNGLMLWVVADNVRKGAATNAVQIAEYLIK